ncbi:MAG: DUF4091 domain-containing protein, partial [Patescibacteria group bacterium]|nr:DUF4091 domain-containing protein [Patescibacteria group bacterium]
MRKKTILRFICVLGLCAIAIICPATTRIFLTHAATEPILKFVSPLEKVFKDKAVSGPSSVSIKAAKNEYESFQAVLTAGTSAVTITNASMSNLTGPNGSSISSSNAELFNIEYVAINNLSGAGTATWNNHEQGWLGPNRRLASDGKTQQFDYSSWSTGSYPDPLVPFIDPVSRESVTQSWSQSRGGNKWALPISVPAGQNRGIFVDIFVPKSSPAGNYTGTFTVNYNSDGIAKTLTMPVNLKVWNITLPDEPTLKQFWSARLLYITGYYGVSLASAEYDRIEERHADLMKKHRMTVPMPYKLTPQADSNGTLYFDDENSSDNYSNTEPALMKAWLDKYDPNTVFAWRMSSPPSDYAFQTYLSNLKKWYTDNGMSKYLDRLYYYLYDEPNSSAAYDYIAKYGKLIPADIKALVAEQIYPQGPWADINSAVDTWVPLWTYIDEDYVKLAQQQGKEVWSYICCSQLVCSYHPDYGALGTSVRSPWWHIDRPTNHYRFPAWITYRYNLSGFLYWQVMHSNQINPWNNVWDADNLGNGEGMLVYPGINAGFNAPIASLRMKAFRDSAEDYEYMKLLEAKSGRNAVLAYTNQVVPEWWKYNPSYQTMESTRDLIGQALDGGVEVPTLSVSLSASPNSGTAPVSGVDLAATVSGTATGNINYTFYCNR